LDLFQDLVDGVAISNTSAFVEMGTMEQYLGAQSRKTHGESGFVNLVELFGSKKPTFAPQGFPPA
jgi:hypothetical protein